MGKRKTRQNDLVPQEDQFPKQESFDLQEHRLHLRGVSRDPERFMHATEILDLIPFFSDHVHTWVNEDEAVQTTRATFEIPRVGQFFMRRSAVELDDYEDARKGTKLYRVPGHQEFNVFQALRWFVAHGKSEVSRADAIGSGGMELGADERVVVYVSVPELKKIILSLCNVQMKYRDIHRSLAVLADSSYLIIFEGYEIMRGPLITTTRNGDNYKITLYELASRIIANTDEWQLSAARFTTKSQLAMQIHKTLIHDFKNADVGRAYKRRASEIWDWCEGVGSWANSNQKMLHKRQRIKKALEILQRTNVVADFAFDSSGHKVGRRVIDSDVSIWVTQEFVNEIKASYAETRQQHGLIEGESVSVKTRQALLDFSSTSGGAK